MALPLEAKLRPAIELISAGTVMGVALWVMWKPHWFLLSRGWSGVVTATLLGFALWRALQGAEILRYRRGLRRLTPYKLAARDIPVSPHKLFLGAGFRWDRRHTQRLIEARKPETQRWIGPLVTGDQGGDPALHGVGAGEERNVYMPLSERVGHTLVLGTTRVGKTRLAELLITQDIRRGDVTIVFDPKGDEELLKRIYAEVCRAGREDDFVLFDLSRPEISARYNPVGSFFRVTEVAGRIAGQLPHEGSASAFREFAWRFTNCIAQPLVALGVRPTYSAIQQHLTNIEALFVSYAEFWLARHGPMDWRAQVELTEKALRPDTKLAYKGRSPYAIALAEMLREQHLYNPVLDGLRTAFSYDRVYFDKITASLLPLLEKLTSGPAAQLLVPDYGDITDRRPIFDWQGVIAKRGIVYVALHALQDREVAAAVGNSMLADLTSVAGQIYAYGTEQGLPTAALKTPKQLPRLALHVDEFNELAGEEFIPLVNKAGGAGYQVTVYTQTISDIEARFGDRAKAGQVIGNFNNLIMMRVKNIETAQILTDQLPMIRVLTKVAGSMSSDGHEDDGPAAFTSRNEDKLQETEAETVTPADLVQLPKGQAFALIEGGQLWKIRIPLASTVNDPHMPADNEMINVRLRQRYAGAALAYGR